MRVAYIVLFSSLTLCAQFPQLATYRPGGYVADLLGRSVARCEDVDGDGIDDFAASYRSPATNIGRVTIFSGADGAPLRFLARGRVLDGFGVSVIDAGDVEGDGTHDLAVGIPGFDALAIGATATGRVAIYSGFDGHLVREIVGMRTGDGFGSTVAPAGDIDGDGYPDLAIGAWSIANPLMLMPEVHLVSGRSGETFVMFQATAIESGYGEAMAGLGDINGDGTGDVLIGVWGSKTNGIRSGRVELRSGTDGTLLYQLLGAGPEERFGTALLPAGDRDGDGHLDFWVSAPRGLVGVVGGSVELRSGLNGTLIDTLPTPVGGYVFGATLAPIGDQDGDGVADLVVGAPGSFIDPGGVFVYSSVTRQLLWHRTGTVAGRLGEAVSGIGDLDGNGLEDLIVAAPNETVNVESSGRVRGFSSANPSPLFAIEGQEDATLYGHAVEQVGDVDADGVSDILVTAVREILSADIGFVEVRSGRTGEVIHRIPHDSGSDARAPATGVGDLDADGHADFAVGSRRVNDSTGEVTVYRGSDASVLYVLSGDSVGDLFGTSLDGIPDADGDAIPDLVVGAPACANPSCLGYVRLFSGIDGQEIRTHYGLTSGELFGSKVASMGDADGDGRGDFVVGAPWFAPFVPGFASIRVYGGGHGSLLWAVNGIEQGDGLGAALAGGIDVNGDGRGDLLAGACGHEGLSGRWWVLSGSNGSLIHTRGGGVNERLGDPVRLVPDMDGDGLGEILVGSSPGPEDGFATLYSGLDARVLQVYRGAEDRDRFGRAFDAVGDVNGDGLPDLAFGATYGGDFGTVRVETLCGAQPFRVNGAPNLTLTLSYEVTDVSSLGLGRIRVSGGGAGHLLGACASAGRLYSPFGGTGMFLDPAQGAQDLFVTLDAKGEASWPFSLVNPSLAGELRYLQVMEIDPAGPQALLGSNGLAIRFCP